MSKYRLKCEYSEGTVSEETNFKNLTELQDRAGDYRYMYLNEAGYNDKTIDLYTAYVDDEIIECNGEFTVCFG